MASRWMWSLTGVPSLCLSFGQSSVDSWGRLRDYPPDITHVSKKRPVFCSPLQRLISAPLPPRLIEGSPAYTVWRLIDVRPILDRALIDQFHQRNAESSGDAWRCPWGGGYCHGSGCLLGSSCCLYCPVLFSSSWSRQSVLIVQWECTDHKLTLPHRLLIPPFPYMSLFFCSSFWVDSFVFACVLCEIHTSLSDPLFPFAAGFVAQRSSSLCGPQTLPASSGISVCVTAIKAFL